MPTQEQLNDIVDRGKLALCYDLDDTLIDFKTQKPIPERVKEIQDRYNDGHYIIICTARIQVNREEMEKFLKEECSIPFHEFLYGVKPKAHIYIDDSAVNADDYFVNPKKYLRIFDDIGFRINWWIRNQKGLR